MFINLKHGKIIRFAADIDGINIRVTDIWLKVESDIDLREFLEEAIKTAKTYDIAIRFEFNTIPFMINELSELQLALDNYYCRLYGDF